MRSWKTCRNKRLKRHPLRLPCDGTVLNERWYALGAVIVDENVSFYRPKHAPYLYFKSHGKVYTVFGQPTPAKQAKAMIAWLSRSMNNDYHDPSIF